MRTIKQLPKGRRWQKDAAGYLGLWVTTKRGHRRFIRADLPRPTSRYVVRRAPGR